VVLEHRVYHKNLSGYKHSHSEKKSLVNRMVYVWLNSIRQYWFPTYMTGRLNIKELREYLQRKYENSIKKFRLIGTIYSEIFVYFSFFSLNLDWISYLETITYCGEIYANDTFPISLSHRAFSCVFNSLYLCFFSTYNKDKYTKRIAILHSIARSSLGIFRNNLCILWRFSWTESVRPTLDAKFLVKH
jgi:hypothetical protein